MNTPESLREAAAKADQEAIDSFTRCDTDGFLSQAASRIHAEHLRAQANLLENDGKVEAPALFLDGFLASTHQGYGQYGEYWVLNDYAECVVGKRFFNPSTAKNRIERDRAKGFTYGTILVDGVVEVVGDIVSARAITRANYEELKNGNFEIIANDGFYTEGN